VETPRRSEQVAAFDLLPTYPGSPLALESTWLVTTQTETITATYSVKMLNRTTGTFYVEVDPILTEDPPSCTASEVMALVERLIRDGPNGHLLTTVAGHEETRYDRERKTRHGRCQAAIQDMRGGVENVTYRYRVYWLDHKSGKFQVEIEP
jgi:hypothetical protein